MDETGFRYRIELSGISKSYGNVTGLAATDLQVREGEFFSLLGPSGCGKSTLLRLIAGFETPTSGRLIVSGQDMAGIPPERRRTGFVFQNYALFPHMTVHENVAFGLRARGASKIEQKVRQTLDLVELEGLAARRPGELSGGQQQRVALARAIAIEPDVLLLDEPLAALDKNLRQSMQRKLVELQRTLRITTVFVTHDQEEALTMSDRLAVMSAETHQIEQIGAPREIYQRPDSRSVSAFLGHSNIIEDRVVSVDTKGSYKTELGFGGINPGLRKEQRITLSLRPERIRIERSGRGQTEKNKSAGTVADTVYLGDGQMYFVQIDEGPVLKVRTLDDGNSEFENGQAVLLSWDSESLRVLADHD